MKVLLVNGSPNKEGCTFTALSEIAKTLKEEGIDSEIYWIGKKAIAGCISRALYKKTGNVWTAAFVNGLLMTIMTVANTTVYYR